jgi:hypothetical protein
MSDLVKKFGIWNVRIVRKGEKYGLNRCLTNDRDDPLVEFYDSRQSVENFGELGQFVSRYYLHTLTHSKHPPGTGLCLDGGVPAWDVDGPTYIQVWLWLKSQSEAPAGAWKDEEEYHA